MGEDYSEWRLDTRHIGRCVKVYNCTDSTNNRAVELANDPGNDGMVVLARAQTAGRGQHGRSWHCQPGKGVLMSVLLFPPATLRRPAILTAWAAVAVCATIRQAANLEAQIKWPNDVLLAGRKVAGILTERTAVGDSSPLPTVCGIGLNVNQPADAFRLPGLENGSSLAVAAGKVFDCSTVARMLIEQLDKEYARLHAGDLGTLEANWTRRLGLVGKNVVAECPPATHRGRLLEISWEALVLELTDGDIVRLTPESVRRLEAASVPLLE